ncbi:MAG: Uma2 family endonuclease, partial [Eubacterium sp.]|nr:Uma2 family endonuclease [Eubacterium sp.]
DRPQKPSGIDYRDDEVPKAGMVSEPAPAYAAGSANRLYTIDDYYALPDDQRVELIDGVFYDMGAPALIHQKILGDLYVLFRQCADQHNMPCEVYLSPCDVRLDMDNYTMVQPDLLVICREYDIHAIRYEGAPDLVVEILSPSTRSKDMFLKLYKYQNAGVREYWVVDPKHRKVIVHYFETDEYQSKTYDFDSEIPIEISHGECSIDFSRIMAGLKSYYEE